MVTKAVKLSMSDSVREIKFTFTFANRYHKRIFNLQQLHNIEFYF